MRRRINLRETRGARGIVRVAAGAELTIPRRRRLEGVRVLDVQRRRAVTYLAGEPAMVPGGQRVAHFVVAVRARLTAGELHRPCGHGLHRVGAIVAQLAKRLGNEKRTRADQRCDGECDEESEAYNLLRHSLSPALAPQQRGPLPGRWASACTKIVFGSSAATVCNRCIGRRRSSQRAPHSRGRSGGENQPARRLPTGGFLTTLDGGRIRHEPAPARRAAAAVRRTVSLKWKRCFLLIEARERSSPRSPSTCCSRSTRRRSFSRRSRP